MIVKTQKRDLLLQVLLGSIPVGKLLTICDDFCIAYDNQEIDHLRGQIEAYCNGLFEAILTEEADSLPPVVEMLEEIVPIEEPIEEEVPAGVFKRSVDSVLTLPSLKAK